MRRQGIAAAGIAVLLLCGCVPANYEKDAPAQVAKLHSQEAKDWFADHMPEAEVKSAAACMDGIDIYGIIVGKYEADGESCEYAYEYESGSMYLTQDYEEFEEVLWDEAALSLGVDRSQIDYLPFCLYADTHTENTPGAAGEACTHRLEGYLPALEDPAEYAKSVLYEAADPQAEILFCILYVDEIPDYDPAVFEELQGLDELQYTMPLALETEDTVYHAEYSPDKLVYQHAVMEAAGEDLYVGYRYKVTESYDGGTVPAERTDELEGQDPQLGYSFEADGTLQLVIPGGKVRPLVLAPAAKEYKGKTDPADKNPFVWQELPDLEAEFPLASAQYTVYSDGLIFPKTGLALYTSGSFREEKGTYSFYTE